MTVGANALPETRRYDAAEGKTVLLRTFKTQTYPH
jgi:hypothetical protein